MKKSRIWITLLCMLFIPLSLPAATAPTPAPQPSTTPEPAVQANAAQPKTQTCVACHNQDGNSTNPAWPKIAGQHENYMVKQLNDFKKGEKGPRFDPIMSPMVATLSDQDIQELSKFYAQQKQTLGKANAQYVQLGERIYRGGDIERGVTACIACHAPDGKGLEAAKFPRLSGQHSLYIENQLRAFRDGKRKNSPNGMMEDISKRLSEDEIKAVSSYIEGLR